MTYPKDWSTTAGIYLDIPEHIYHADRASVNNSALKRIGESPKQCRDYLDNPHKPTPPQSLGRLLHAMVLEPVTVNDKFYCVPQINPDTGGPARRNTKHWARCEGEAGDRQMISYPDWEKAGAIAREAMESPAWQWLLEGSQFEVTIVWQDSEAYRSALSEHLAAQEREDFVGWPTNLWCRGRIDIWKPYTEGAVIFADPKTAADPFEGPFSRAINNFGYHQQNAFYSDGGFANGVDVHAFVFPVIQSKRPYEVALYDLVPRAVDKGRRLYLKRLQLFATCVKNGEWPPLSNTLQPIDIPGYAYYDDEETL